MSRYFLAIGVAILAVAAGWAPSTDVAQAQSSSPAAGAIKRLPDGTPDIRGTWNKAGGGLNESNAPPTELLAFGVLSEPQGFGQGPVTAGPEGGVVKPRVPQYEPNPRPPAGIINPANRELPYTPAGRERRLDYAKNMCCPAKNFDYIELSMRCIPPHPWQGGNMWILQRPGAVVFLSESNHGSRVIYTDGRPRPASNVTFYGGYSTGRWEGNTLIVETTNYDGKVYFGVGNTKAPFSEQFRTTERYTVVSDKLITFELTYIDPWTFTQPVVSAGYLYPLDDDYQVAPEITCHEGSYALPTAFGF